MKYKSNRNIVYSCKYHIIWCTKYRRKVLNKFVEERLKEIVTNICTERNAELIEIECDGDHVHILVEVDPQYGIHRLVKSKTMRVAYLEVNEAYSSMTCSACGCISSSSPRGLKGLAVREWTCADCGAVL